MTVNATDMSTPVTRGELRAELERFTTKADLERFATKADLERFAITAEVRFATKVDLDLWGGALRAQIEALEQRFDIFEQRFDALDQRLHMSLARHVNVILEAMSTQISVVDDKYADLPPRVNRLEGAVFGSKDPDRQAAPARSRHRRRATRRR